LRVLALPSCPRFQPAHLFTSLQASGLARRAYLSHIRAYATHPAAEKDLFSVSALQLGHLAKAFALREAPAAIKANARAAGGGAGKQGDRHEKRKAAFDADEERRARRKAKRMAAEPHSTATREEHDAEDDDSLAAIATYAAKRAAEKAGGKNKADKTDAEARMYAKVRAMGRATRKGGVLAAHGADEFQIG
jgi:ATP-dependent RNA helicase DDX31/DBP7